MRLKDFFVVIVTTLLLVSCSSISQKNVPTYDSSVNLLSDGNIVVKVRNQEKIVKHLQNLGWTVVTNSSKIVAEISDYGPADDSVIKEDGVLVYPITYYDNPVIHQNSKYCAHWYAYSIKGYPAKVAKRLKDLSDYYKNK
jgi:predicted mannosyl-3-phosphoglycerate phosphatase (HAD superfamily)